MIENLHSYLGFEECTHKNVILKRRMFFLAARDVATDFH